MQRLPHILFAVIFFITATTYSQVAHSPSSDTLATNLMVATHQEATIKSDTTVQDKETSQDATKEEHLSMIRVHSAAETKPLKSGSYIWNGKQWEVFDISIIAPYTGLA